MSEQRDQTTPTPGEGKAAGQLSMDLTYKVAFKQHFGEPGDCAIIDAGGAIVAETFRRVGWEDYRDAEALARLFCAAPELLAEVEEYYWHAVGLTGTADATPADRERVARLEQLLAKVRGRTPEDACEQHKRDHPGLPVPPACHQNADTHTLLRDLCATRRELADCNDQCHRLMDELVELRNRPASLAEALQRERALKDELRAQETSIGILSERLTTVEAERDEARAEVEKLRAYKRHCQTVFLENRHGFETGRVCDLCDDIDCYGQATNMWVCNTAKAALAPGWER